MAITTSPDNIPSPTSGDPYNYVVDMAAIADGTQDALTQKANMGVGTSTQRTAALSKFPNGALWYDTTTSSNWRRVAGAWVNQDTGWTNITLGPVTAQPGFTPQVRKDGNLISFRGGWTSSGMSTNSSYDGGTLPSWAVPTLTAYIPAGTQNGAIRGQVVFDSGYISIRTGTTVASYYLLTATWPAS